MYSTGLRILISAAVAATLGAAIFWSARIAIADLRFRRGDAGRAIAADPYDARYRLHLADAEDRPGELAAAVHLNPRSPRAWIDLGLRAEAAADLAAAERYLLEAARVDATWLPRWTLANFYFRRGDPARFWKSAAEAGRMAHGDSRALYELCWMVEPDPRKILETVVADRAEPAAWFYHFLLAHRQLEAAAEALDRLGRYGRPQDRPETAAYCDIALEAGRHDLAVTAWNRAIARRLLPYAPLGLITNGNFAVAPLGRGFDWRLPAVEGVTHERLPRRLRIVLGRSRPERCDLLWQYLALPDAALPDAALPDAPHRLTYVYDADSPAAGSGLRWEVRSGGAVMASEPLSRGEGRREYFQFRAAGLARLVLVYEREPGRSRWEGAVTLREVSAAAAP